MEEPRDGGNINLAGATGPGSEQLLILEHMHVDISVYISPLLPTPASMCMEVISSVLVELCHRGSCHPELRPDLL